MLAFPGMLVNAAKKAGMAVPKDPDKFDADKYPHFQVFCAAQLCRRTVYHGEHFDNAKVIAKIPKSKIKQVTLQDLIARGLSWST